MTPPDQSLTQRMLDVLLSAWTPESASPDQVGRCLFDFCACALGGLTAMPARWGSDSSELLAAAGHALDRDDIHWDSLTHPGSIVWPVVLGLGRQRDASGPAVARAATLGYEVMVRLALALGPSHRRRWHSTATTGTVGAAVAAGILLDLDRSGLAVAAGHAISVTGGSARCLIERSGTRVLHRAHAARTGLECARAAAAGLSATRFGLEGEQGLLSAMADTGSARPDMLLTEPSRWVLTRTGFRLHAASGFAQSAIDASLQLGSVDPAGVVEIRVQVNPAGSTLADNSAPISADEAWWSIPHAVAVCLATGDPDRLEKGLMTDPTALGLMPLVILEGSRQGPGARLELLFKDGSRVEATVPEPLGHPDNPASDELLLRKWYRLTGRDGSSVLEAAHEVVKTGLPGFLRSPALDPLVKEVGTRSLTK